MSYRKLLGLKNSHLTDYEITKMLEDAEKKHLHDVELKSNGKKVKLHLDDVEKAGIMRGYEYYYPDE